MSDAPGYSLRLRRTLPIWADGRPSRIVKLAFAALPKGIEPPPGAWYVDDRDMEPFTPVEPTPAITFHHRMSVGSESVVIGNVGFCIYCGAAAKRPGTDEPCTDEHVIPKGLGGKLIIGNASCRQCADAVNSYEGNLLRNLFNAPRRSLSVRGRRRTSHPTVVSTIVDGAEVVTELPVDMHPSILLMPSLYLPQMMSFNEAIYQGVQKLWTFKLNQRGFSGGSGLRNYFSPELDFLKFGQLLTKIAFSYSMSFSTIDGFTLQREPLIAGKVSPLAAFARTVFHPSEYPLDFYGFVGGFSERYRPSSNLHEIGRGHIAAGGFLFEVVYIWLFASLGAPIYCVITDWSVASVTPAPSSTSASPR